MRHILAHATASPQEAEEVAGRLRAAGVEVEVRNTGANNFAGVVDPTRPAWELWVDEAHQPSALAVVQKAAADFAAQGKELEKDLEAEAVAAAPAEPAPNPADAAPAPVSTTNARVAAGLMAATVLISSAQHLRFKLVLVDPFPLPLSTYLYVALQSLVAFALWKRMGGARGIAAGWAVLSGLYFLSRTFDAPLALPLHITGLMISFLLLLAGGDSTARRWSGLGLWAVATLIGLFPLTLLPHRFTEDKLVGLWNQPHTREQAAFCADGRFYLGYPVFSTDGRWERVGLTELTLTTGAKVERHHYYASGDHLALFKHGWERSPAGDNPCDQPKK